jgi:CheY-like chemotaxis protein
MIHVLLVDDDEDLRQSLAELLGEEGFRVTQAVNGKDALKRLAVELVDVILLDYMMPEMDGLAFSRAQRAHPGFAHIPVILLTAAKFSPEREAIAADLVLEKPFRFPILLASIQRVLARQGSG